MNPNVLRYVKKSWTFHWQNGKNKFQYWRGEKLVFFFWKDNFASNEYEKALSNGKALLYFLKVLPSFAKQGLAKHCFCNLLLWSVRTLALTLPTQNQVEAEKITTNNYNNKGEKRKNKKKNKKETQKP